MGRDGDGDREMIGKHRGGGGPELGWSIRPQAGLPQVSSPDPVRAEEPRLNPDSVEPQ